jgi:hypothetical protein
VKTLKRKYLRIESWRDKETSAKKT